MELSLIGYVMVFLAAFFVGFNKTSFGGVGLLSVLLMALAIPGKASVGALLPMLVIADMMALFYYRKAADWSILLRVMVPTIIGVIIGYFILDRVPTEHFNVFIGFVILFILLVDYIVQKRKAILAAQKRMAWFFGSLAGTSSMVSNTAGPVFEIYLLQMRLSKEAFVGTRAWFFLMMNTFKVPFAIHLGIVTTESFTMNLMFIPAILLGAVLGYLMLKRVNVELFRVIVRVMALVAALRLIFF